MKTLLIGVIVAASLASVVPASAQRIDIGPGGPSVDLRSRDARARDDRREEYRRDRAYEDRMYRRGRYEDDDRPRARRGYAY